MVLVMHLPSTLLRRETMTMVYPVTPLPLWIYLMLENSVWCVAEPKHCNTKFDLQKSHFQVKRSHTCKLLPMVAFVTMNWIGWKSFKYHTHTSQTLHCVSQYYKWTLCQTSDVFLLTLTLPGPSAGVSGSLDSYCSLKPLCSGMGEVVPAHTSPTLLPPSPRTVLSLSCFKVSQCINCRDWHCKS